MSQDLENPEAIFGKAIEIESPEDRAVFLDRACEFDAELRRDVEQLVTDHFRAGDFLERPAACIEAAIGQPIAERPGQTIGRYKLLEQIGDGGMGVVYVAEQTEPVRRKVALKIIKPGMDTRQVIARFEVERQALALMDHPNVAKIHDGGATETGRPYFVMELVRGVPITQYCDENRLTTTDRLKLFIDVCHAVQHAHQKGVIHRDIKPTNVMVTEIDGKPVPKVIDFGIAKATRQRLTEKTLNTSFRQFIGTPQYMSPEQASMGDQDVDTRTDIYSLGVLLYELLAGTTPFDPDELHSFDYDKMCRIIRETEPATPSRRLSTLGVAITTVSEHRRVQPPLLHKLLRGDVDWIVMKALEKNRDNRYATAKDLSDDIVRFLEHRPILARKPTAAQQISKWSRRHRALVRFGGGMLVVALIALSVTTVLTSRAYRREAVQRQIAQTQAARSKASERQARDAVDRWLTRAAEDLEYVPGAQQVRQGLLEDALEFYERFLEQNSGDPELRHEIAIGWQRIGTIHSALGSYEDANEACQKANNILEQLCAEFPLNMEYAAALAANHLKHAGWFFCAARYPECRAETRKAVRLYEQLVDKHPHNRDYINSQSLAYMALALALGQDQADASGHYFTRSLDTWAELASQFDETPKEMVTGAWIHHKYGEFLGRSFRLAEAEIEVRKAIDLCQLAIEVHGSDTPRLRYRLAQSTSDLGYLMNTTGRFEEAARALRQANEIYEEFGTDLPKSTYARRWYVRNWRRLSNSLLAMGRMKDAEEALRKGLVIAEELATIHPESFYKSDLGHFYSRLGTLFYHDGRRSEAHAAFTRAMEQFELVANDSNAVPYHHRPSILFLATCPDTSFRDASRAVDLARESMSDGTQNGRSWQLLGVAQYEAGEYLDAIETLQNSRGFRTGGDRFDRLFLAMAYWQLGEKETARRWYAEANDAKSGGPQVNLDFTPLDFERLRADAERLLDPANRNAEQTVDR